MKKKATKIIALIVAILFFLGIAVSLIEPFVYAAPSDKKNAKSSAWEELKKIENEINQLGEDLYQLDLSIQKNQEAISDSEKKLIVAEEMEEEQRKGFRERFTLLSESGTATYLEMIFSAESFSDLIEKIVIVREMAEYDRTILDAMEEVKTEIQNEKETQEQLLEEQEEAMMKLEEKEGELLEKSSLASEKYKALEDDPEAYGQYLAEEAEAEGKTKSKAGLTTQTGTVDSGRIDSGYFIWPTDTRYITSDYSPNRENPVTGEMRPHTGTDVGAQQGAPVWAAQSGTVILAENNGGYGNCVIIDHGNGVKTLYGHMSAILVNQGDSVTSGAQIGRVGSTGNSTGPHLHYEVLVDGAAVDPMQFYN